MEPEPEVAGNKALDPGEHAVIQTSSLPQCSKALQEQTVTHTDQEQEANSRLKMMENMEIHKKKLDEVVDKEEGHDEDDQDNCEKGDKGNEYKLTNNGTPSESLGIYILTNHGSDNEECQKLRKIPSFGKTVRFSDTEEVEERDSSEESLFPDYEIEEWTDACFEELFMADDWIDITNDRLLRKKVLEAGSEHVPCPIWAQEVTIRMQGVLEDRIMVEKDCKLVFVIGEGDVNQALEKCALSMRKGEIALLLADSQYTYGLLGREPDIPAWTPILYQLQLLEIRDKADYLSLPISDRIRIGNQKRERGNFYFQREEYSMAAQAYYMALDVLTTHTHDDRGCTPEEDEEVCDYRVKCLNNMAAAQLKLEQYSEALHTSQDVLFLDPNNVKALFRKGKLLSDKGDYEEAMETLKKALKLEPSTKAIHAELSRLVKRQAGVSEMQKCNPKSVQVLGENVAPILNSPPKKSPGMSWKLLLGALVVALGSLVTSVVLTARN